MERSDIYLRFTDNLTISEMVMPNNAIWHGHKKHALVNCFVKA